MYELVQLFELSYFTYSRKSHHPTDLIKICVVGDVADIIVLKFREVMILQGSNFRFFYFSFALARYVWRDQSVAVFQIFALKFVRPLARFAFIFLPLQRNNLSEWNVDIIVSHVFSCILGTKPHGLPNSRPRKSKLPRSRNLCHLETNLTAIIWKTVRRCLRGKNGPPDLLSWSHIWRPLKTSPPKWRSSFWNTFLPSSKLSRRSASSSPRYAGSHKNRHMRILISGKTHTSAAFVG